MSFAELIANAVSPPEIEVFSKIGYEPHPRQQIFHDLSRTRIYSILYGGSASSGKTAAATCEAIWLAVNYPGMHIACMRRSFPELKKTFIPELAKRNFGQDFGAKWNGTDFTLKFPNGAAIDFTFAETEQDASRLQGAEYQAFFIDEATLMTPVVIQRIEERLRSGRRDLPVIGFRALSNPVGVGLSYFRDRFIRPTQYGKIIYHDDLGRGVAYIPAKATDNPHVDKGYIKVLDAIADPARRAAMRDGDWDAVEGAFFSLMSRQKHSMPSFEIPKEWRRYCGIDYGFAAPFAAIWAAVDNDGRLYVYRELHMTQVNANNQAQLILQHEALDGDHEVLRVADPSMWGSRGTPLSIADIYGQESCGIYQADNNRIQGWATVNRYLSDGPACEYHRSLGQDECPMVHIFEDKCPLFIDHMLALPTSKNDPDDAETHNVEDHLIDSFRYLTLFVGSSARPVFFDNPAPKSSAAVDQQHQSEYTSAYNPLPHLVAGRYATSGNMYI